MKCTRVLVCAAAAAAFFAASALADGAEWTDASGWTYGDRGDGTLEIVSSPSAGSLVYVPESSGSADVVSVAAGAFAANPAWTVVVLPPGIESLDENAFAGCANLRELYVPIGALFGTATLWLPANCKVIYYSARLYSSSPRTAPPKVTYTVTFRPNGGKGAKYKQSIVCGTTQALAKNAFKKSGYVFAGWSTTPTGAIAYANKQKVRDLATKPGANVNLYAQWAVKSYKVRFYPVGATGKMAVQKFTYGKAKALRANAFKYKGRTFLGWGKKSGSVVKYLDGQTVKNLTRKGTTVKLYAKWRVNKYKVRFVANGGTGTMADETFKYGKKKALTACSFKRADCIFLGWAKTKSGKVVYTDAEVVKNLTAKDGKVVTLYARWAKKHFYVHFDANGGKGTMANETFTYTKAKALSPNAFTKKGAFFVGWARTPTATKARYYDGQKVKNLSAKGATITLYAVWSLKVDPNVVLCVGDSITAGIMCVGDPYPTRLQRLCGKKVVNNGVGGVTSRYGEEHIQGYLEGAHPGTVCILYGANDARRVEKISTTMASLRSIIRACKAYGARPIIATQTPQIWDHSYNTEKIQDMASATRSLARSEGVTLVDLNAAFGDGRKYINPVDGLHLSNAGGDLVARMFFNAL